MFKGLLKPLYVVFIVVLSFWLISKLNISLPLSIVSTVTNKTDIFSVSGEGKVTAKPDTAQISLGITIQGSTVAQVQTKANEIMNKITADLKKLGISDKDIQTSNYSLRPDYNFAAGSQKIVGYTSDVNLQVKIKDFQKINSAIDVATSDGANQVGGLSFIVDDPTNYEDQAREMAIKEAKKKAEMLAKQAGLTLGRIINVMENQQPQPRPIYAQAVKAEGTTPGIPTQVEPGSTEIVVDVTLTYETR